jgi:dTDP-4-dehydrorhamnose 3,5-epimerase
MTQEPNGIIDGIQEFAISTHEDSRGRFTRTFDDKFFESFFGQILQVNLSENPVRHTLRGMHYQTGGPAENKVITLLSGSAFLVVLDLRFNSSTHLHQQVFDLNAPLKSSILVPAGCATGWLSLSDNTNFQYLMSARYEECTYSGIPFNDPFFNIPWPAQPHLISTQDKSWNIFNPIKVSN